MKRTCLWALALVVIALQSVEVSAQDEETQSQSAGADAWEQHRSRVRAAMVGELSNDELCAMFKREGNSPELEAEILRRKLFTESEWRQVKAGTGKLIGAKRLRIICALGEPKRTNVTVTEHGREEQLVYSSAYVYISNGRVRSVQYTR
jgi:hypothetical protein